MTGLLFHPDGPCKQASAVPLCRYASRNDGVANDLAEWDAFIAAVKNGPKVGRICAGDWRFPRRISLSECYGTTLSGEGCGASRLFIDGDPAKDWGQNGVAFTVSDAALCTLRDFAVHCSGAFIYGFGIMPSQNGTCDRTWVDRIEVSGSNFSDAAVGLYRSGEVTASDLSLFNYGDVNSAAVHILETGGTTLQNTQYHQYACKPGESIGPATIYLNNAGRTRIIGGILGSEPDAPRPFAKGYLHLGANVDGLLLEHVLMQSDNGRPPNFGVWVDGANVKNVHILGRPGTARLQIQGGTGGTAIFLPNGGAIPGAYVSPNLVY